MSLLISELDRIRTGECLATGWTAIWRLYRPIPEGLPVRLIIIPNPLRIFITPIYKTSAARYCHEKNRDLNGNGILEPSEIHWYMPSQKELLLMAISLPQSEYQFAGYNALMSSTELEERNMSHVTVGVRFLSFAYSNSQPKESQTLQSAVAGC